MKRKAAALLAATALVAAPAIHAHHIKGHDGGNGGGVIVICKDPPCPNGMAIGQDAIQLLMTRSSNAGIGNGGEKGKTESRDWDPGNSGAHNQAADDDPICELIKECDPAK